MSDQNYIFFTVKQVFSDMDFLGWYTTGEQPTSSDINVHKQVSVQNKQVSSYHTWKRCFNTVVSNHVNSDHVPSFSCLDVWNARQTTSGDYAITVTTLAYHSRRCGQGSRWRAIRAKKSPCGCSLRFVLVPKEKWKSPCNFTKSLC